MIEVDPNLRRAKQVGERDLLNRPGVTGVDIGFKQVRGQRTDVLAIRVLVRKKRDVRSEEVVPDSIDGFPTDVIERQYELEVQLAVAAAEALERPDTELYPVLAGGMSIGPCRPIGGTFVGGTLGLPVKDNSTGKSMLLSNFHVLCGDLSWSVGDLITQPARIDGGRCPGSTVASLQRGVLDPRGDCAVAEITDRPVRSEIVEIGPVTGTSTAMLDAPVRKRGRTTGLTFGFVDSIDATVIVPYPGVGDITFTNQIGVRPDTNQNPRFSTSGDSGSVVVNDAGEVIGLHFSGSAADGHSAANPIGAVLAALDVSIPVTPGPSVPVPAPPTEAPPTTPSHREMRHPVLTPYPPPYAPPRHPPVLLQYPDPRCTYGGRS